MYIYIKQKRTYFWFALTGSVIELPSPPTTMTPGKPHTKKAYLQPQHTVRGCRWSRS